mgnify:CR=1 FL=1
MHQKISKAYENLEFLNSKGARSIRVLCELLEPKIKLENEGIENTIVFFGSARSQDLLTAQNQLNELEARLPNEEKRSGDEEIEIEAARRIVLLSRFYDEAVDLSKKLTLWSKDHQEPEKQYVVCSGGGPGMMEAANRGASQAKGKSIGLGISLPFEQGVNSYANEELSFEFHYFFIRKFYFLYHAKAVVVFPGGFGTMDELFEALTLIQTKKLGKKIPIYLYGSEFWEDLINFDQFIKWGVISPKDINLFRIVDGVDESFEQITNDLINFTGNTD